MTEYDSAIVLSSRVRLARNLKHIPFRARITEKEADECIEQVLNALKNEPVPYRYLPMRGVNAIKRQALVEDHKISPDLFRTDDRGAALIRGDDKVVIMINEEDHLRIQSFSDGLNLKEAAAIAFDTEDSLGRHLAFAFDRDWGYLTACPTNTGTGMRASVVMHLPMLTLRKSMGQVMQLAAKLGLTMRGMYGEGSEALGHVYQLSNQVTLGKTEEELLESVSATAAQIAEMEMSMRRKALEEDSIQWQDQCFRSLGLMLYARKMPMKEFYAHWSDLRLASGMGLLPVSVRKLDNLLSVSQDAHLMEKAGHDLTGRELEVRRATLIRERLSSWNRED
ncbi:MAG: ATP--guanido phosphotransferase [Clostridia bacterium]|nr:ATP--guanido phosphotransferase [Clostridia bacterium]